MKVVYLGNTSRDTDDQVALLAKQNSTVNHGLITQSDQVSENGFYHTTVVDITASELAKIDAEIVMLDQSRDSYTTSSEYHLTREWAKLSSYWKKLVDTNSSFCIFPFINHSTKHDNTTLCCRSTHSLGFTKDFNWKTDLTEVREKMLAGLPVTGCESCYATEKNVGTSDRKKQTVDWAQRLDLASTNDLQFDSPIMYDLFPNNRCNQMCRMCIPEYSVLIEREQGLDLKIVDTNWNYIDIDTAQVVYIAGGEPTAMSQFIPFLERCLSHNRQDLEIRINTNAQKISNRLFDILDQFENIKFTVSVDGYGRANDYQRWLSNWDGMIKNVQKINQKHHLNFNITVGLYTALSFCDLIEFLNKHYSSCIVNSSFVSGTLYPFIIDYSEEYQKKLIDCLELAIVNNNPKLKQFIKSFVQKAQLSTIDKEKLKEFFEYDDKINKMRDCKLIDFVPELEAYRNKW